MLVQTDITTLLLQLTVSVVMINSLDTACNSEPTDDQ